jgi:hypothetical protein
VVDYFFRQFRRCCLNSKQPPAKHLTFSATNLRRDTIKVYPFALSLSKGERLSRSWFDKLTTNGLTCPALSW